MKLATFQTVFKIGFPIAIFLTIPLTLWVATTFRDPNAKASSFSKADINGDGKVNGTDLDLFTQSYASSDVKADINGDGKVDSEDFALFKAYYNGK